MQLGLFKSTPEAIVLMRTETCRSDRPRGPLGRGSRPAFLKDLAGRNRETIQRVSGTRRMLIVARGTHESQLAESELYRELAQHRLIS
jgi:hypothetical protein